MADYGEVIGAEDYTQGIAEHPDIPQSDAGIIRIAREKLESGSAKEFRVLELGCGPGRLTKLMGDELLESAEKKGVSLSVVGLDISKGFISFAESERVNKAISYILGDFLTHPFEDQYDVIVAQGLFHHVSQSVQPDWFKRVHSLLNEKGIFIISDEYIPDYSSAEDRTLKTAGLYAYVVGYALQTGHESLAELESMNMVDDVCAGLPGAGHSNKEFVKGIEEKSREIFACLYEKGISSPNYTALLKNLVEYVQTESAKIAENDTENHDRFDFKTSIQKEIENVEKVDFSFLKKQVYGPVDWIFGMAVLVFKKS